MMKPTEKIKVNILVELKELFNPIWRYFAIYGGRSSGKSVGVAQALIIRGRKEKLRILCTRQIQNTIKDSVHKLLKDKILEYGFTDYKITDDSIVNMKTGTEFIFKGLLRNIQEIKSLEGIDVCWVEEAQNVTKDSIEILTPTIRKAGSQIIFTFNRFTELDPVFVRFVLNKPPHTCIIKINYDILERRGFLPAVIKDELEFDKANNPELYAHKWLGEPMNQVDFAIVKRNDIIKAMSAQIGDEGQIEIGVDVARMGDDRTVFVKRKGLATKDMSVYQHLRTTEVCDRLEGFADYNKETKIKVDDTGVGGGVTDEMIKRGYNIMAINFGAEPQDKDKYPNLISEAWFYFAEIMSTCSLPLDQDLMMELSNRQWRQDSRGRRVVESKGDYKKRGFRSPDIADAFIICYYNPILMEPAIHFI